ncbi:MAG: flagellar export protein FliJ [Gammaproteobacteria bacterium]
MDDINQMRKLVNQAKREECRASNDMYSHENQANHEQSQLETCLTYKEECLNGLKTAKDSGLSVVQIRECQLLVQYIDSVVETRQYKADISQENYQQAKAVWQKKQGSLESLKQALKKLEAEYDEHMIDEIKPVHDKIYRVYDG